MGDQGFGIDPQVVSRIASEIKDIHDLGVQVAVVIGGTGVLCGAQADGLAMAGANVVVAGREPVKGAARVKAIEDAGGTAIFLPVDVMERDSIENLLKLTITNFGRVDMLINGAPKVKINP